MQQLGSDLDGGSDSSHALATAFTVKTNDELMIIYISTLVRAIIAFHDLIENKLENKKLNENKAQASVAELSLNSEKKDSIEE